MKTIGSGAIVRSGTVSAVECLRYALNLPTAVVITGLDSMERVELVVALESALSSHPEDSELANVYSVRELVETLLKHRDASATTTRGSGWEFVLPRKQPTRK